MSIWHLLIIAFILLMVFGPNRIGDMGGSLGKAIRNFKKGLEGIDEIDVTHTTPKEQLHPGVTQAPPPSTVAQQPTPVAADPAAVHPPKDPTKN
jgi:sec-independent protein translocase protein TatA